MISCSGLEACKHNLHGRIIWPKGSTPLTVVALRNKLSAAWNDLGRWGVSFIGKGYYEFYFSNVEDLRRVRFVGSWNLEPGLLKLFAWTKDFSPAIQQNFSAQVWVRIYGLSQEYWRPNILFAIASSVGSPICTDEAATKPMFERTFGQFVRVLVDIDLSQPLKYKVLVERKGYTFFVDFDYENLPPFCTHCNMVGHHLGNCKKIKTGESMESKKQEARQNVNLKINQVFVQTKDGRSNKNKYKEVIDNEASAEKEEANRKEQERLLDQEGSSSKTNHADLMKEQDMLLEKELTEQHQNIMVTRINDDGSSTGSEFVDATQNNLVTNSVNEDESIGTPAQQQLQVALVSSADTNQINMKFLKESWANMPENVDEEARLLAILDKEIVSSDSDGFQIQMSKHQKKAQKKKQINRENYATRSRGSHKPFK